MADKAIVPFGGGFSLPSVFGEYSDEAVLGAGIQSGFGVVSFRGKVWRVKYKGEETIIRDGEGEPVRRLTAIIVGANPHLSKAYYRDGYSAGDAAPPDCASVDGIRPDASSPEPQNDLCATCRHNQLGTSKSADGQGSGKGKACQDAKRLAIVPANDPTNEAFGGPMLLRVPPTSLSNLQRLEFELRAARVPFFAAIVDISFDLNAEWPLLIFKPKAVIQSNDLAATIIKMRESPEVESILTATAAPAADPDDTPAAKPAAKPVAKAPTKPAAKAAAKPAAKAKAEKEPEPEPDYTSFDLVNDGGEGAALADDDDLGLQSLLAGLED